MPNRNVDKGREAENAVAAVLREHGMVHAERRAKRGGTIELECSTCRGEGGWTGSHNGVHEQCRDCQGAGACPVPADAGDVAGIPGVVVQVKWSGYKPLAEDMRRTDEQRRAAGATIGLLVRKRKNVGAGRAGQWDAYLPSSQVAQLYGAAPGRAVAGAVWHTELGTAARLLAAAGYAAAPIPA